MSKFRVIVSGSRIFREKKVLELVLEELQKEHPNLLIIEGEAKGADVMARDWAQENGVPFEKYPVTKADWEAKGKAAGVIRNKQMLDTGADLVIAFPVGQAKGTNNMIKIARKAGVEVRVYRTGPINELGKKCKRGGMSVERMLEYFKDEQENWDYNVTDLQAGWKAQDEEYKRRKDEPVEPIPVVRFEEHD
jgi:predicted Fe-Mo cluster-binding NifX family protein